MPDNTKKVENNSFKNNPTKIEPQNTGIIPPKLAGTSIPPKVEDTPQRTEAESHKVAKTYVCPSCLEPYWHLLQNELDWYNRESKQKQQELDNTWLNQHKKVCPKRKQDV